MLIILKKNVIFIVKLKESKVHINQCLENLNIYT